MYMEMERLDKILAGTGEYTRSEARQMIVFGSVSVDDAVIRRPETKVSRGSRITAAGRVIDAAEFVYIMMNKPRDYVSAAKDEAYPAVTRLLSEPLRNRGVFCVGRLDADVTGLLILTDDGAFAHRVTSPRSEIKKTYEVNLDAPLTPEDAAALKDGIVTKGGTVYRPAELTIREDDPTTGLVAVTEGKFHEVKNLMSARGKHVVSMRRLSVGGLRLDPAIATGEYRRMTQLEVEAVFHKNV